MLECPECRDINPENCEHCGGEGQISIPHCPLKDMPPQAFEMLDLADLYDKGKLPAPGGYHDQPAAAMDAIRLVLQLRSRMRAALMSRRDD